MLKNKSVVIIGTGSIGLRHYKVCSEILKLNCFIKSSNKERELDLKNKGFNIFKNDMKFDLGIIATTSDKHIDDLIKYSQIASKWIVEKPLVSIYSLDQIKLNNIKNFPDQEIYVGYNKRFEKGIIRLREQLKNKRVNRAFFECLSDLKKWRNQPLNKSISLNRNLGGGVINELSHEIDLAYYFLGEFKNIRGESKQLIFKKQVEDYASLLITHKSGIESKINISFASEKESRKTIFELNDRKISYNHLNGDIINDFFDDKRKNTLENTFEERDQSFKRQIEFVLFGKNMNVIPCSMYNGLHILKKVQKLKWPQ